MNHLLYMVHNHLEITLHLVTCPTSATVHAWNSNFQGNAAEALLSLILELLNPHIETYACATSVINSSGTGKSRMVDEVSKTIIAIPICLCQPGSQGASFHYCHVWLFPSN